MKLIVGLGNPGADFARTRHNFGFLAADFLAKKWSAEFKFEKKFFGKIAEKIFDGEKILILKPENFMNCSGKSVAAAANFFQIPAKKICIFFDDVDIFFGENRFRENGSAGGHNGVKSIIENLGTKNFPRLKFGIRNEFFEKIPTEKFVLQKFSGAEIEKIPEILAAGIDKFEKIFF